MLLEDDYAVNVDSISVLGQTHSVCEDYVVHESMRPLTYIILADGCSSSEDTDIGARLLVKTAERFLKEAYYTGRFSGDFATIHVEGHFESLAQRIIGEAATIVRLMAIDVSCLDATLIVAAVIGDSIKVFMFGDGVISQITTDDNVYIYQQLYTENAPFYLSYQLNLKRLHRYKEIKQTLKCSKHRFNSDLETDGEVRHNVLLLNENCVETSKQVCRVYEFPLKETKILAVMSDGVEAVQCGSDKVDYKNVTGNLLNFKNFKGEFVKRRVKRVLRDYQKDGYKPMDDFSMGAFRVVPDSVDPVDYEDLLGE